MDKNQPFCTTVWLHNKCVKNKLRTSRTIKLLKWLLQRIPSNMFLKHLLKTLGGLSINIVNFLNYQRHIARFKPNEKVMQISTNVVKVSADKTEIYFHCFFIEMFFSESFNITCNKTNVPHFRKLALCI